MRAGLTPADLPTIIPRHRRNTVEEAGGEAAWEKFLRSGRTWDSVYTTNLGQFVVRTRWGGQAPSTVVSTVDEVEDKSIQALARRRKGAVEN